MPKTFTFGRCHQTMYLVFGLRGASPAGWSAWVDAYAHATVAFGVRRLVVVSQGGGPNARQQSEIRQALVACLDREALQIRTAVCSDSLAARLITRAIGWLAGITYIESFGYLERAEALAYLGVPGPQHEELLGALRRAEIEVGSLAPRESSAQSGPGA